MRTPPSYHGARITWLLLTLILYLGVGYAVIQMAGVPTTASYEQWRDWFFGIAGI